MEEARRYIIVHTDSPGCHTIQHNLHAKVLNAVTPREFVYVGEPVPKMDSTAHREFLQNLEQAMLLSLVERGLLTKEQAQQALELIERKGARTCKKSRKTQSYTP